MLETPILSVLIVLLALASAWDVALHRIPNTLAICIAVTGVLAQALDGNAREIGWSVLAVVCVGVAIWPAWASRWIGGGDLKLAAATAAWLEIGSIPAYLLAAAIAVGAISVLCYAASARAARIQIRHNLLLAAKGDRVAATLGGGGGRVQVPAGAGFAIAAIATLARAGAL